MERSMRLPFLILALIVPLLLSCVTVRPQQRGILSDPIMRFGGNEHDALEHAHVRHTLDNREGAFGAEGVSGGGCGCN
jgi:hypothetical protein